MGYFFHIYLYPLMANLRIREGFAHICPKNQRPKRHLGLWSRHNLPLVPLLGKKINCRIGVIPLTLDGELDGEATRGMLP